MQERWVWKDGILILILSSGFMESDPWDDGAGGGGDGTTGPSRTRGELGGFVGHLMGIRFKPVYASVGLMAYGVHACVC